MQIYRFDYVISDPINAGRTYARETPTPVEDNPITKPAPSPVAQPEQSRPIRESAGIKTHAAQLVSARPAREVARTQQQPVSTDGSTVTQTAPLEPQPVSRKISRTVQRIVTRPSTRENNVYAAPGGSILHNTPEGWQQRDQNTWKNAAEAPTRQGAVRDSEVRQRAAERTARPGTQTSPHSVPKRDTEKDERRR